MSRTRSSEPVVVGVDAGTTLTKAVAFSVTGEPLARAARPTRVDRVGPGWYEQDADLVVASVEEVLAELRESTGPVLAIGVTAQGDGLWLVDADGRPVRPAISWMDGRAAGIVRDWDAAGLLTAGFRRTGTLMFPGAQAPLLAWLAANEPEQLKRAAGAAYCKDVILHRLTGVRATDPTDQRDLLDLCGLGEHERLLLPARTAPSGRLPDGTPVVAALYDLPASALGAGVTAVGDGLLILGTTLACQVLVDAVDTAAEPAGLSLRTWAEGRWLRALPAMVGTAALDWALRLVSATVADLPDLLATGDSAGLSVLPYFSEAGERAPFVDPRARGRLDGLHLGTRPADVVRAVCEAIAYSARHCLTAAGLSGELTACGGGLATPAWAQIFADVLGRPIRVLAGQEVGARGAALAAAAALPGDVVFAPVPGIVYEPQTSYEDRYARYLDHVEQARNTW
ncbi:sugar (pentulose or hexulose) kinase [Hamadaea flava]|uniref:FGGY family carbohydrate kinase n=1 Tax=Hamadaea flava TaxID=1742688 RepID=A0ABV8LVQ7_9ACTN|nr:FGGY-family carbohydrate kinase [Hamadaea flava]MCP2327703.1 sugar (pentulose or hexulose) kinase [Hamadaea flava]